MAISAEIASPAATPSWKWIEVTCPSLAALQNGRRCVRAVAYHSGCGPALRPSLARAQNDSRVTVSYPDAVAAATPWPNCSASGKLFAARIIRPDGALRSALRFDPPAALAEGGLPPPLPALVAG